MLDTWDREYTWPRRKMADAEEQVRRGGWNDAGSGADWASCVPQLVAILAIMNRVKGSSMSVSLTAQLEEQILQKVESGLYASASDVVREALQLLDTRDRDYAWLRQKMTDAEEQVRRGEVVKMTDTFWDDLDREVDERIARGHVPSPYVCP